MFITHRAPLRRIVSLIQAFLLFLVLIAFQSPSTLSAQDSHTEAHTSAIPDVRLINVPSDPAEKAILTSLGSSSPDKVAVAIALPANFNPENTYPVLITQVTGDKYRPNIEEIDVYREIAQKQGYLVITAQAIPWPNPKFDLINHRYVAIRAALRWLEKEYPGSSNWPIVFAGFSGGAKMSQILAASLPRSTAVSESGHFARRRGP